MSMFLELVTLYKKDLGVPTDLEQIARSLSRLMGVSDFEILKDHFLNQINGRCVDKEFRSQDDGAGEVWCVWEIVENAQASFVMFTGYYQSYQGYEGDDVFEVDRLFSTRKAWIKKRPLVHSQFANLVKKNKLASFLRGDFGTENWMKQLRDDYEDPLVSHTLAELELRAVHLLDRCCNEKCCCETPWSVFASDEPDGRRFTKVVGWGNWMYGAHFKDAFEVELQDVEFIEWKREKYNVRRSSAGNTKYRSS